jgi:hypothetical protein
METDLSKLIYGLTFAFVSPIVCYATGMAWNKVAGAPPRVKKIWASFCLLLPMVLLGMLVQVGWDSLRRLWMTSPYVLALLTLVFGVVAPAALIAVIMRLWRPVPHHHDRT